MSKWTVKGVVKPAVLGLGLWWLSACANTTTLSETVVTSLEIQAPREQVFDYMSDPQHAPSSAANLQGTGLGATNDWTFAMAGKSISGHSLCVDYTPNQRKVFAVYGDIKGTETYLFVPAPGGTKVVVVGSYFMEVPAATPQAAKQAAVKGIKNFWESYLKRIKVAVEK